jgi:hypothetical protein
MNKNVIYADDETRKKIHILGVMINNFIYHYLYEIRKNFQEVDPSLYQDLLMETIHKIMHEPENELTGPAKRKDLNTIKNHLLFLERTPEMKELYLFFTERILNAKNNE